MVTFLEEVDAVEDMQARDLPEILGGVLPGLLQLPKRAGEPRQHGQHERGAQAGDGGSAAAPAADPFEASDRPGEDRFVFEEAFEVVGEIQGCGVTLVGLFVEALEADGLQVRMPRAESRSPMSG